jgi:23S rRNA (uracil1939-C5)-methyltransferase
MKLRKTKQKQLIEQVLITDAAAEGNAIAKVDEMVIFVPFVVPGDVVDLEIYRKKKTFAQAKAVKIHKYSEKRVEQKCPHFTQCGGCKWQTLEYSEQVKYKQQQVRDNLERIGKVDCSNMQSILPSENIYYYRNKLEFTFSTKQWVENPNDEKSPQGALGFHAPSFFDKVIDIQHCVLQDDISNKLRNHIREYSKERNLEYYDIRNHVGFLRGMIIRTSSTGELMLIVIFAKQSEEIKLLLDNVKQHFPQITSLMYCINEKYNDSISDQDILLYSGNDHITETMQAYKSDKILKFKIRPKTFYQTNPCQAERLYSIAADFAEIKPTDTVYDLYTGTGTIANYIAHLAKKVVGVEYVEDAVEDARLNSEYNQINNTTFIAGDMAKILTDEFIAEHGTPDVVITDPPRAGMAESVVNQLIKIKARKIVYISCNPATQARDLEMLSPYYKVGKIRPVDMFPHTHHVENVVELSLIETK